MKLVAFSDTHAQHHDVKLPDGDVLIFAGDLMTSGWSRAEVMSFGRWFSDQPHEHKILVAGNHDRLFETNQNWCLDQFDSEVIYMRDSGQRIMNVKFYGSPVQPWFHKWAFNVPRGPAIKEYWDQIPEGTQVLITHGPPYGHLDKIVDKFDPLHDSYAHLGCEELALAIRQIRPKVHIFGHIHGSYGAEYLRSTGTRLYNVAICNEEYNPVNAPVVIDLEL